MRLAFAGVKITDELATLPALSTLAVLSGKNTQSRCFLGESGPKTSRASQTKSNILNFIEKGIDETVEHRSHILSSRNMAKCVGRAFSISPGFQVAFRHAPIKNILQ